MLDRELVPLLHEDEPAIDALGKRGEAKLNRGRVKTWFREVAKMPFDAS